MREISPDELKDSPVAFVGALDFDRRAEGISPRRLPAWTRPQVPQMMDAMARIPAGVRLAFVTNSSRIHLRVLSTIMVTPPRPPRPVVFDLEIDGEIRSSSHTEGNRIILNPADPQDFKVERGKAFDVQFEDLGSQEKLCQLWLPHNALVEIRGLALDDDARLAPPPPLQNRWVHYGSSISHCMEALQPTGTWPAVASRLGEMALIGMGFGGQCHLDQFVARSIRDLDVDFISIKTGINVINMDSMRERTFIPALHGFIDTLRERKPDTPILITSPIYCPSTEDSPGPTIAGADGKFVTLAGHDEIQAGCLTLKRVREIISDVVDTRRRLGDRHLGYQDGLTLFSADDAGDLPDDLHPNPQGYERMGERFHANVFAPGGLLAQLSDA